MTRTWRARWDVVRLQQPLSASETRQPVQERPREIISPFARSPALLGFVLATFLFLGQVAVHAHLPLTHSQGCRAGRRARRVAGGG